MVIIGTTDTDYPEKPETVHSERADVDYLLGIIDQYFPEAKIKEEDILSSYAGVRPLVHDGSSTESGTSREHVILHTPQNVTFVAGGKYTTYRRMARDVIENVLKNEFSLEDRIKYARNQTRYVINPLITAEKLNDSIAQAPRWAQEFNVNEKDAVFLAERHGFEAREILQEGSSSGLKNIWEMEALFAMRYTMCRHLRDFMLRRSPLFLATRDHGFSVLDQVAAVFQKERGWSGAQLVEEKKLYFDHLEFELGWRKTSGQI
jgi:glycerol-3-phosphate dehydrogenase